MDTACTGTTLRDFMRVTDLEPLPDDIIGRYDRPIERNALATASR